MTCWRLQVVYNFATNRKCSSRQEEVKNQKQNKKQQIAKLYFCDYIFYIRAPCAYILGAFIYCRCGMRARL